MHFVALTIFPEMFKALRTSKIVERALAAQKFTLEVKDLRDFAHDKHRTLDDIPYGGGAGMIMKPEPLVEALETVTGQCPGRVRRIYLSAKGSLWSQSQAQRLLKDYDHIILLCGRYQGIDQRVIDGWIDEEISIGPYIVAGGELPAMVLLETMMRLTPGVLGNPESLKGETHSADNPEYPQYTRPNDFRGLKVPEVLLSGDHAAISAWRQQASWKLKK